MTRVGIVDSAGITETGRVRRTNEDSYLMRGTLFMVADGMGGAAAGEIASAICAEAFAEIDLIRNGGAHQYQQAMARLTNGRLFALALTGAEAPLGTVRHPPTHLAFRKTRYGDILMYVHPDTLFLDFREAVLMSGLLKRKRLRFRYVERGNAVNPKNRFYRFPSTAVTVSLAGGGHPQLSPPLRGRRA